MPIDPEKLAKLQKASGPKKVGGSRIKVKKGSKNTEADDTKLQATLKKLNAVTLDGVDEANFFKNDGNVLHFNRVGVQQAAQYNTHTFTGYAQEKPLNELIPGILPQMGAENLNMLQQLAERLQNNKAALNELNQEANAGAAGADDEEVPTLVENFDDVE
ncbi:unnamed protein product [Kuraishia capsulata CBS 1993]|uniref:Nascent polypeptide-associated complex subunit beta n=1 Tax=Kuraishia capsulata CBS 1993 TaxID=1382522 RepID=W6MQS9_9ASCO|nr:uncharacterized protein KUCA_T00005081001 [Kuraishia capsulata CBS 1993]CDK29094.1 unnamed protein product [Kuraishia capsulata CBS 1993]